MINSLYTYVLNIFIHGIFEKDINLFRKNNTILSNSYLINMADLVAVSVETLRIDNECFLAKEFIELIYMNPRMVLCQTVNQVDSCHNCLRGPLTWAPKISCGWMIIFWLRLTDPYDNMKFILIITWLLR